MRTYEHIFIVHPDAAGDDYAAVLEKFKGILTEQGANILKVDEWGSRKLAYPVKKQVRGTYVLLVFDAEPQVVAEFERRLRIDEKIIKFQTILLPNGFETVEKPEAEKAAGEESPETAEQGE